jgi:type II secretory pathway pseudopilin PulG
MARFIDQLKKGTPIIWRPLFLFLALNGCASLTEKRPVQEMANMLSSLRAAKEVSAESLAPEYYRQAIEAYTRAKNEYRFKNFSAAKHYAIKAKEFAEEAEFNAIANGANRASLLPADEPPPPPPPPSVPENTQDPSQQGIPAFMFDQNAAAPMPAPADPKPTTPDAPAPGNAPSP